MAQIRASLKTLHEKFLSRARGKSVAGADRQVKDKMTYGKVQFTFAGYLAAYPDLSEANKQKILRTAQTRPRGGDGWRQRGGKNGSFYSDAKAKLTIIFPSRAFIRKSKSLDRCRRPIRRMKNNYGRMEIRC